MCQCLPLVMWPCLDAAWNHRAHLQESMEISFGDCQICSRAKSHLSSTVSSGLLISLLGSQPTLISSITRPGPGLSQSPASHRKTRLESLHGLDVDAFQAQWQFPPSSSLGLHNLCWQVWSFPDDPWSSSIALDVYGQNSGGRNPLASWCRPFWDHVDGTWRSCTMCALHHLNWSATYRVPGLRVPNLFLSIYSILCM